MQRLLERLRRFVPGPMTDGAGFPYNRIAQGQSHDRALAAFKAEQLVVARRARQTVPAPESVRA